MLRRLVEYEYSIAFSLEYAVTRIRCHAHAIILGMDRFHVVTNRLLLYDAAIKGNKASQFGHFFFLSSFFNE